MSLAMAYLAFYVANLPLGVSGVTAVVVLGLFGSATGKWQMCVASQPPFSLVASTFAAVPSASATAALFRIQKSDN